LDKFIDESNIQESKTDSIEWILTANKMPVKTIETEPLKRFPDGHLTNGHSSWIKFDNVETVNRYYEIGIKHVDSSLKEAEKQHEANLLAIENNKRVIEGIDNLMGKFGILKEWSEYCYKTSRHRSKEWVKSSAIWPSEVRKTIPTTDAFEAIKRNCASKIAEIEQWKTARLAEIDLAEQKKLIEKCKAEETVLFYKLCAKYDITPTQVDWEIVIGKIIIVDGSTEDLTSIKQYFDFDEDDY
jgi:hypothetical protein